MRRSCLASAVLAALPVASFAGVPSFDGTAVPAGRMGGFTSSSEAVLYDNIPTGAETVFSSGSSPRTSGADEFIINGGAALLKSMQFGFSRATNGPTSFTARIRVWDDLEPVAFNTGATTAQFLNLRGDFTVNFTGIATGAFISSPIDLTGLPGGGISVSGLTPGIYPTDGLTDAFFQIQFNTFGSATTLVPGNGYTFIFDGSGVNTGFTFDSPAVGGPGDATFEEYWRDANGNQVISGDEQRVFGGTPIPRANMVLHWEGDIVPEPTSLGLVGLGLMGLGARRRK